MRQRNIKRAIGLYLALVVWALWMGGTAFYFGVVVPTGGDVIGGSEQGYVTQRVTNWLNLIGLAALAILLCNSLPSKSWFLLGTWAVMAACHVALVTLHWQLDGLIDAPARAVSNSSRFLSFHEIYETVTTVQWLAGMAHLAGIAWPARSATKLAEKLTRSER